MISEKKSQLILFTSDFPYGTGETFLETEIVYLTKGFDEVKIVSQNTTSEICRILPENCTVERFDNTVSLFDKISSLFGVFHPLFWKERQIIKAVYGKNLTKGIITTMLISLYRAKKIKAFVLNQMKSRMNSEKLYYYSYWCDDTALGLAMVQKETPKIKTLCRIHRWDVYFEESTVNYLPYRHFITENISKIFSISQDGIDYALQNWKVNQNEKFSLSRLGVNNPYGFQISNNDPFLLLSCSNIIPVKRVHLIAEALREITDIAIKWVHIGDGSERKSLEVLMLSLPSNIQVELLGRIPNADIYTYYAEKRPDLFINVSASEGVPVSIMEAMSFGIPVIATDVGGNSEIVNEENGQLIPDTIDSNRIKEKLISFLSSNQNEFKLNAYKTWEQKYQASINYHLFVNQIGLLSTTTNYEL